MVDAACMYNRRKARHDLWRGIGSLGGVLRIVVALARQRMVKMPPSARLLDKTLVLGCRVAS
jgi:hypothetical protein